MDLSEPPTSKIGPRTGLPAQSLIFALSTPKFRVFCSFSPAFSPRQPAASATLAAGWRDPDKINRMWFYGITDIDEEFRLSLKESHFKELYSKGQVFHTPQDIYVDESSGPFSVDLYVLDIKALITDAEARN